MKKKNKTIKTINWIINILIIILIIVVAGMVFWRIFGNSPTDFQLISGIFGLFGASILKLFILIYNINREIGELKIGVKESFNKIKTDMEEIKQNLNGLIKRK